MSVLEQFDDSAGQLCYRFTLPGAPRTKKNGSTLQQFGKRRKLVPTQAWRTWRDICAVHVAAHRKLALGLERPVSCAALFYRHADVGDSHGFYNGVADVL